MPAMVTLDEARQRWPEALWLADDVLLSAARRGDAAVAEAIAEDRRRLTVIPRLPPATASPSPSSGGSPMRGGIGCPYRREGLPAPRQLTKRELRQLVPDAPAEPCPPAPDRTRRLTRGKSYSPHGWEELATARFLKTATPEYQGPLPACATLR